MEIASKIASKIPLTSILDDIRDSLTNNELERIHLLTRKDLNNISQCFNLNSEGIRHKNEVVSIESWVEEYRDSGIVLFYKAQGILSEDFSCLKKEDFVLIIMHPGQLEILEKFAEDVICIDGTHDFELTTLLILDDMREVFPCCFMIGNRSDEEIMTIFFIKIKEKLGRAIKPYVFMSDMAHCYCNAWVQIMCPATFRLFCSWHVDRAWKTNLDKIDGKEKKVIVYKQLRTLLQETDTAAFTEMLEHFRINLLSSPETHEFGIYFEKYYLINIKSWAYCYRLHAGINTNMRIERMHQLIKYLYLNGKQVKRLDKTINTLMKLIRDKIFDRLITLEKGKLSSKIRELRRRHKTSHVLDMGTVISCEMGWEVPSSSQNGVYLVKNHKANCDCKLVCASCEAWLHSYSCSCLDNSIRMNMCKHIHLVCQFLKGNKILETEHNSEDEEHALIIDETIIYRAIEKDKLVNIVNKSNPNPNRMTQDLEIRKQKLIASITQEIQNISSFDQLEAVEKITAPIYPTLRAMAVQSVDTQEHAMDLSGLMKKKNIPHNKNILPQRRLFSTKSNSKKPRKKLLAKPKPEEAILIANQMLINS